MHQSHIIWATLLSVGMSSTAFGAQSSTTVNKDIQVDHEVQATSEPNDSDEIADSTETSNVKYPRLEALKELKTIKADQLKVNANAAQADEVKDPLQPLNREIYKFNDMLDRNFARPIAVQYKEKVPAEVRGTYHGFRKNLGEPWNAVNQIAQGRFLRAAKTLGRFTINTVTTLGLADPATRLGLETEDEDFGTTLGYYGVPSGPYVMLPIMGPSTFRDGIGRVADNFGRPQKYILDHHDRLYYGEQLWRGIDVRSELLDVEQVLQGDKYAALRDAYLQKKNFDIAQKKGLETDSNLFIDDVNEDVSAPTE
ncbi:MlaA family lipoprotein [Acinetobacter lanii]|uniref:VacJ family lipoprotein n=1 Tax=Acinetobacter lanii TaxID=2715163 RepID=A0A6G8S715_9GAMM|nr:VacJ family lipoprotein [Acinetobacter lanii]QIO09743.1 VacJ family lipoprotein [Acinetobacter lanii]